MLKAIDDVRRAILVLLGAGVVLQANSNVAAQTLGVPASQLAADLAVARQLRVLFYHHSVGANILEGLGRLDAEQPGRDSLRLAQLERAATVAGPMWIDVSGSDNGHPRKKMDYFASLLRKQAGPKPDVAMMKLCYVDFDPKTDVDGLFDHYRSTVEALKREQPGVRIVHFTVPLTTHPDDLKSKARRLLGREVWEDAANVKRAVYNRRLIETFKSDPVFDLARFEATAPDGTLTTFSMGGQRYMSLYPGYTDDGGHLNASAQRQVAAALLRLLAVASGGSAAR